MLQSEMRIIGGELFNYGKYIEVKLRGIKQVDMTTIIVLDRSGSMSGGRMKAAKKAAMRIIEELDSKFCIITYAGKKEVDYIQRTYYGYKTEKKEEDDVDIYDLRSESKKKVLEIIKQIEPSGNTSFSIVCEALKELVKKWKGKPQTSIIFLTDGCDTCSEEEEVNKSLDVMIETMEKYTTECQIHSIGISKEHDVQFMGKLVDLLPVRGTYQYVENSEELLAKIEDLIVVLKAGRKRIRITEEYTGISAEMILYNVDKEEYRGIVYIPKYTIIEKKYTITVDEIKYSVDVEMEGKEETAAKNMMKFMEYFESELLLTINKLAGGRVALAEVSIMMSEFMNLSEELIELKNVSTNIEVISSRTRMMRLCQNLSIIIRRTLVLLKKYKEGNIDREEMAKLYDMVHMGKLRRAKEYEYNARMDEIENYIETLKIERGGDNMGILRTGDCECMGIQVERRDESNIVDVTNIIQESVTIMQYKAQYNKEDMAYNAVLPLYINEIHWELAKLWMKVINCGPELPFLALSRAMEDYGEEETRQKEEIVSIIIEVCQQILKENEELVKEIKRVTEAYIKNVTVRMSVKSNKLLIMQIFVAKTLKYLSIPKDEREQFTKLMCVEEARRDVRGVKNTSIPCDIMMRILNVDEKIWIEEYAEKYRATKIEGESPDVTERGCKKKMIECLKRSGWPAEELEYEIEDEVIETGKHMGERDVKSWKPELEELSAVAKAIIKKVKGDYKKYGEKNMKLLSMIMEKEINTSLDWLDTNIKKLAFALQTYIQHTANTEYVVAEEEEIATAYIKRLFMGFITCERARKKEEIDEQYKISDVEKKAVIFARTDNILVAAGALNGAYIGRDVMKFARKLQEEVVPHALEKLNMMLYGQYRGVTLYGDRDRYHSATWKLGKQNCFRFWRMNYYLLEKSEWKILFKTIGSKASVDKWYESELEKAQIYIECRMNKAEEKQKQC